MYIAGYIIFVLILSCVVYNSLDHGAKSVLYCILLGWLLSLLIFMLIALSGAVIFTIKMVLGG